MEKTLLDWDFISWEDFETLTVYLAQDFFKKPFFEKYLRPGNKQRGIDIRDTNPDTNQPIYLQCKHEKLNTNKLETLLEKFTKEPQWEKPCQFILATTCNLQTEEIQLFIDKQKQLLSNQLEIDWFVWDVHFLEQELRKQFRLVQRYFSLEVARRHCLPPNAQLIEYNPYPNFIPRKVSLSATWGAPKNPYGIREPQDTFTLMELLSDPVASTTQICLIADAYEGKSILLDQTAYELTQSESRLVPLLIRLKNTAIEPIESLLENTFDGWLSIPSQQLVIIIDGLDEVPGDRFIDVVNNLNVFVRRYSHIRLLFACRKLFYNQYELPKRLTGIRFYELEPLNMRQTNEYLQQHLGSRTDEFYKGIRRLDLEPFLAYPFYLLNLVKWYSEGVSSMPGSKIDVVNRFITESLDTSAQRRLSAGVDLDQRRDRYKRLIRQFALALQLSGTNALHYETLQQLFEPADLELLQAGSILSIEDRFWSFSNAIYQEQLAALALKDYPTDTIVGIVSIGKKLRKIRLKWVQTLASYISLLPEEDPGREAVIQLIEQDNIELLTVSDGSKFSTEFRLDVFRKIFEKYIRMSARPILASDTMLGAFSRNDAAIISYLFELLQNDIPEALKVTVCRTLSNIRLSRRQTIEYGEIAFNQLQSLLNPYYAELLMDHMGLQRLGSAEFTELIFSRKDMLQLQEYRDGVYKYLTAHEEVDRYYDFGLEGLKVLYLHNKDTNHFGSELDLQDFLLSTKDPKNLKKLFGELSESGWQEFYQYKASETTRFLNRLTNIAIDCYYKDSSILADIVKFVLALGRNHLKEEFRNIDRFFFETGTNREALIIYLDLDRQRLYSWELADLITPDCFSLLIDYVNNKRLTKDDLRSFIGGLYYRRKHTEAKELQTLTDDTFGKEPINENSPANLWHRAEESRKLNDQRYIQSVDAFREGIVKYFQAFGRQEIEEDELYLEPEDKPNLIDVDSYFVQSYLRRSREEEQRIYLSEVLRLLGGPKDFFYWRAEKLLHYEFKGLSDDSILLTILEEYYNEHISHAVFENAYYFDESGQPMRKRMEYQLCEIWKKHSFKTPDEILLEMTWMEIGGIRGVEHDQLNKRTSLSELLLEHFADRPALLAERIIAHLRLEISHDNVLASHIGFCKYLKLYESVTTILDIILIDRFDHYFQYQAIDVYVALDGDKRNLLDYLVDFKDYNDYVFIHLIKLLRADFPNEVTQLMLPAINYINTSPERKMDLAQQLSNSGVIEGFDYIITELEKRSVAPLHIQHSTIIWQVDTLTALNRLKAVAHMLVDPAFDHNQFWESPKQFIIELLFGFSKKGEDDLLLVEDFMHRTAEQFLSDFPVQSAHLLWHAERAIDQFRESQQAGFSVSFIRQLLKEQIA
ncbi:hypothetical protein PQ469_03460 [Mucilaginibacter sp. KACC 22773]|uniref:NACHT domain-containing protein n=1 Tax=Mucilaginibacter sp. KACC 22773 TaxID=3025671 RepID=UPI002365FB84|nr:hypothetical protein [Mucilaginibacter sp. KACC 22773]WDF79063.1 hypothetical protein PQ469_03460 [Mucilaginibacter sp. KACC 22773]